MPKNLKALRVLNEGTFQASDVFQLALQLDANVHETQVPSTQANLQLEGRFSLK